MTLKIAGDSVIMSLGDISYIELKIIINYLFSIALSFLI